MYRFTPPLCLKFKSICSRTLIKNKGINCIDVSFILFMFMFGHPNFVKQSARWKTQNLLFKWTYCYILQEKYTRRTWRPWQSCTASLLLCRHDQHYVAWTAAAPFSYSLNLGCKAGNWAVQHSSFVPRAALRWFIIWNRMSIIKCLTKHKRMRSHWRNISNNRNIFS